MLYLKQLRQLAEAAQSPAPYKREQAQHELKQVGIPQTLIALLDLVEQMGEALEYYKSVARAPEQSIAHKALSAYERFGEEK